MSIHRAFNVRNSTHFIGLSRVRRRRRLSRVSRAHGLPRMPPHHRAPLRGGRVQREQHGESQVCLHARLLGAGERRGGEQRGVLLAAAPVRRFHFRSLSGGGGPEIRGGGAGEGGGEEDSRGEQKDRRPQRSDRVQVCYSPATALTPRNAWQCAMWIIV